jgi:predicted MFS family arabinose efflux permease
MMGARAVGLSEGRAAERGYWTAWVATVIFFAGFYALLTPLPRHLAAVGLPDWQIGLVLGVFGVASLLGRPAAGRLADRYGARPVMLAGAAALLIGVLPVGITTSLMPLIALRLLQATGYVAFTTAATGLVVTLSPPEVRGRRLAVFGTAANVAITLTPAAVSALLAVTSTGVGFVVSAALAFAAGLLAWTLPAAPPPDGAAAASWAIPRRLWAPMASAALFGCGFAAFFQFVPILAERRATIDASWLYTLYGVALILSRFGAGGLVDRWGVARVLAVMALLMAGGLAIFAFAAAAPWLILATVLVAASGLFHPALIAHHAALLPGAPGAASAAFYIGFDLGIGLGSWLLGAALQLAGLPGLYLTAALAALASLALLPAIRSPRS